MILERAHVNSHSLKILHSSGMTHSKSLTSLSLKGSILATSDQCKVPLMVPVHPLCDGPY